MPLQELGFEISNVILPESSLLKLDQLTVDPARGGRRDLLAEATVRELVEHLLPITSVDSGSHAFAVSATIFAKQGRRNWRVTWHQDTSVAASPPGRKVFTKEGIPHVQPGDAVLSRLCAVRVHLDEAGERTGGLSVVPRSHTRGVIVESEIGAVVEELGQFQTNCPRGSLLLMKPLLLHSSSPTSEGTSRRVLHIVFAPTELRHYEWAHTWPARDPDDSRFLLPHTI